MAGPGGGAARAARCAGGRHRALPGVHQPAQLHARPAIHARQPPLPAQQGHATPCCAPLASTRPATSMCAHLLCEALRGWICCSARSAIRAGSARVAWEGCERSTCAGLRVLIYNGDHDLCVPHTGAEAWTRSLALPPLEAWRPWLAEGQARPPCCTFSACCNVLIQLLQCSISLCSMVCSVSHAWWLGSCMSTKQVNFILEKLQVAGYLQAYEGLTYATVLGAGHFVPECKPAEALHMITSFLADTPL